MKATFHTACGCTRSMEIGLDSSTSRPPKCVALPLHPPPPVLTVVIGAPATYERLFPKMRVFYLKFHDTAKGTAVYVEETKFDEPLSPGSAVPCEKTVKVGVSFRSVLLMALTIAVVVLVLTALFCLEILPNWQTPTEFWK